MYRYMESKKGGKDAGKQKEKEKKSLRRGTPIFFWGGGNLGIGTPYFISILILSPYMKNNQ